MPVHVREVQVHLDRGKVGALEGRDALAQVQEVRHGEELGVQGAVARGQRARAGAQDRLAGRRHRLLRQAAERARVEAAVELCQQGKGLADGGDDDDGRRVLVVRVVSYLNLQLQFLM